MTTETLMTDQATTTTDGTPASQPAEPQSATGAEATGQQQQPEQQSAEAPVSGEATQDAPQGAPETYEFVAPEGVTYDAEVIGKFSEVAKELNLPQDQAQAIVSKVAPAIAEKNARELQAEVTKWTDAAKTDKEFGGENLSANLATAKKALDAFASPELKMLLTKTGLGNHPELIRAFYRAGQAISEDGRLVTGGTAPAASDPAKRLFPNQR